MFATHVLDTFTLQFSHNLMDIPTLRQTFRDARVSCPDGLIDMPTLWCKLPYIAIPNNCSLKELYGISHNYEYKNLSQLVYCDVRDLPMQPRLRVAWANAGISRFQQTCGRNRRQVAELV